MGKYTEASRHVWLVKYINFYPRDAMLARYLSSSCVRLSVGPPVTNWYSILRRLNLGSQTTPYDSPGTEVF